MDEAVELLLVRSQAEDTNESRDEAGKIVHELRHLPLAIEQAAAYIREASRDIYKFLSSYRKKREMFHSRTSDGNQTYTWTVATTWSLSFQRFKHKSEDAAELLNLLPF